MISLALPSPKALWQITLSHFKNISGTFIRHGIWFSK
jgi:hypothetical protein